MNWINGYLPDYNTWGYSHPPVNGVPENGPGEADACWSDPGTEVKGGPFLRATFTRGFQREELRPAHKWPRGLRLQESSHAADGAGTAMVCWGQGPGACRPACWVSDYTLSGNPQVDCFAKNFTFILHSRDLLTKETTRYTHTQVQFFYRRLFDLISTYDQ